MKKVFIILVAFLSLFLFTSCNSEEENKDVFSGVLGCYYSCYYSYGEDKAEIHYGDHAIERYSHYLASIIDSELIMPDYFNDLPVGDFYFENEKEIINYGVTKVRVGENIYLIGDYNFKNCRSIVSLYVPENVRISSSGLNISKLEELTCLSKVRWTLWLNDCPRLKKLTISKETNLGSSCESIYGLNLEEIVMPEDQMYYYTPDNKTIYLKKTKEKVYPIPPISSNVLVIDEGVTELTYPFKDFLNVEEVILPKSLMYISDGYFEGWTGLKKITLNEGLKEIGERAFYGCSNLESIVIPDSVEKIGKSALANLPNLKSLTIGKNAVFDDYEFQYDHFNDVERIYANLVEIKVNDGNKRYDSRENCNALIDTSINEIILGSKNTIIPSTVKSIGAYAFVYSPIEELTIPGNVKTIREYAFMHSSLKNVSIESGVESICKCAFWKCNNLTSVELPDTITNIGAYVFLNCINLESVKLSNSLDKISKALFYGDSSLTTIYIDNNIKSIEEYSFGGCKNYSLLIGSNVLEVYISSLDGLKSISYNGTMEDFSSILVNDDESLIVNVICSDGTFITNQKV